MEQRTGCLICDLRVSASLQEQGGVALCTLCASTAEWSISFSIRCINVRSSVQQKIDDIRSPGDGHCGMEGSIASLAAQSFNR
jgi:hypothetical protein